MFRKFVNCLVAFSLAAFQLVPGTVVANQMQSYDHYTCKATYVGGAVSSLNISTYTFSSQATGPDVPKIILLASISYDNDAGGINSVTIDGTDVTSTGISQASTEGTTNQNSVSGLFWKAVTGGTSSTFVIDYGDANQGQRIEVYYLTGACALAYTQTENDTGNNEAVAFGLTSEGVNSGVIIAASGHADQTNASSASWTGITERTDQVSEGASLTTAMDNFISAGQVPYTIRSDANVGNESHSMALMIWVTGADCTSDCGLTFVTSATSTSATVTVPSTVRQGDLLVLVDTTNGAASQPATVQPIGWREFGENSLYNGFGVDNTLMMMSWKIARASDAGASVTGMAPAGGASHKTIVVYRAYAPIVYARNNANAGTADAGSGDPATQTVFGSNSAEQAPRNVPFVGVWAYGGQANQVITTRSETATPTHTETANGTAMYVHSAVFTANENWTYDTGDNGSGNVIAGGLIDTIIVGRGEDQADFGAFSLTYITTITCASGVNSTTPCTGTIDLGAPDYNLQIVVGVMSDTANSTNFMRFDAENMSADTSETTGTRYVAVWRASFPSGGSHTLSWYGDATTTDTTHLSVWRLVRSTNGPGSPSDSSSGTGSGNVGISGLTIPTGGAGVYVCVFITNGLTMTWTNATERYDASGAGTVTDVSSADRSTAGTVTTTCTQSSGTAGGSASTSSFGPIN